MSPQSSSDPRATHKCKYCGAWHGGMYAVNICNDCWSKGKR